jgi:hypothetical protein
VLWARITTHKHSSFLLNPHQKFGGVFIIFVGNCKSGQGHLPLQNRCHANLHLFKANTRNQWPNKLLHDIPTFDAFRSPNESVTAQVIISTIERGLRPKVKAAHVQAQSMHKFPSLRTSMQGYLTVEPHVRPSNRPFVLDSPSKPHFTTPSRMEIDNANLLVFIKAVNNILLRLVM